MNNQDPLAQLKDIHMPEAIHWWPLAPGWYALIICGLLLAGLLSYYIYRHYRQGLPRKKALILLDQYEQEFNRTKDSARACAQISELLRRVALVYYPRSLIAGLHADSWIEFLEQNSTQVNFKKLRTLLVEVPFQKDADHDPRPLFQQARLWIKQRRRSC